MSGFRKLRGQTWLDPKCKAAKMLYLDLIDIVYYYKYFIYIYSNFKGFGNICGE